MSQSDAEEVRRLQAQLNEVSQHWSQRMQQVAQAVQASKDQMEQEWRCERDARARIESSAREALDRATAAEQEVLVLRQEVETAQQQVLEEKRQKQDALVALEVRDRSNKALCFALRSPQPNVITPGIMAMPCIPQHPGNIGPMDVTP